jgi:histidinol phosphatase-like enzyme (inositol monophosphatase family)
MTNSTDRDYTSILADCEKWAQEAAIVAKQYFRQPTSVDFKSDESPVTAIDQLIEKNLKEAIFKKYPNDSILGEESGTDQRDSDNIWVIDPIDGTRSFISGNPLFGMLIAYVEAGSSVAGDISMPMLDEIYTGSVSGPARCNGQEIKVSGQTNIDEATLYINEGEKLIKSHPDVLQTLLAASKVKRFGYDCYPHALLASGHVDAVVDYDLKPYDYLSLSAVIKAAGGVITDWQGNDLTMDSSGEVLATSSLELHEAFLELLVISR